MSTSNSYWITLLNKDFDVSNELSKDCDHYVESIYSSKNNLGEL